MPKNKEQKKAILDKIKDKIAKSKAIVFSTDKPNPDLLDIFTIPIIRKDVIEKFQASTLKTEDNIYSGPYVFEKRESDTAHGSDKITISANTAYTGNVLVSKYIFRFFS